MYHMEDRSLDTSRGRSPLNHIQKVKNTPITVIRKGANLPNTEDNGVVVQTGREEGRRRRRRMHRT